MNKLKFFIFLFLILTFKAFAEESAWELVSMNPPMETVRTISKSYDDEIFLNGSNDLTIDAGNELIMSSSCKITSSTGKKVIVKSGGTLRIKADAEVTLDVPIEIEAGGQMIFEDNSLAWIDKINILGHSGNNQELVFDCDPSKYGVWVLPVEGKSGKITIGPGVTVTIPKVKDDNNSKVKEIAIIGGLKIEGTAIPIESTPPLASCGYVPVVGKLIVEADAKLDIGPISSTTITEINIKKGAKVVLFAESLKPDGLSKDFGFGVSRNVIKGKLKIGIDGISTSKTEIKGFYGNNPYRCNSVNNFVHAKFLLQGPA
ncbi:MAG: hypothetical protein Q8M94_01085, partial [Ignavibacteria bacterium]|nr:hypothetical protein [Ignavibacteria bacterium]